MGRFLETSTIQSKRLVELAKRHPITTGLLIGAAVNKAAGEILYSNNGPTRVVSQPYDGPTPIATGIAFPGMGNSGDGGAKMARCFSEIMPGEPWGHMQYDNSKILTVPILANALKEHMNDTGAQFADFYTSSTGGVIALEASHSAGVPIRTLIINSGPYSLQDGYGSKLGSLAAKLPDTGPLGKGIGTVIANIVRPGSMSIRENLSHAIGEITEGSTKLFKGQVGILKEFDPDNEWRKYDNVIIPGFTQALFISPPPGKDDTVRVGHAFRGWEGFFDRWGITLDRVIMPDGIHAETESAIEPIKEWLSGSQLEKVVFSRGKQ
ncbi:MAG TPA: hypothetical protein VM077_04970 [Candidatus Limnocylindrales bacterium]|nr:hypothetical protein [Candidatus Limnocylindrales bacterium]